MRKNNKFIIFILILFISIGFAYLSTNLYINGTSIVKRTTWSVYFDNIENESTTGEINTNATISTDKKEVDFEVTFDKPGDTYTFNVDVVNDGTLDAMLESFKIEGLEEQADYMNWYVYYDDGIQLNKFDLLKAGTRDTLLVVVNFEEDVDINYLPTTEAVSSNLKFIANYVQADQNGKERESNTYNIRYNLDGGTISNNPTTYNSRLGATIPNPTKEGYTFAGWTGGKNLLNYNDVLEFVSPNLLVDEDGNISYNDELDFRGWTEERYMNWVLNLPQGKYILSLRFSSVVTTGGDKRMRFYNQTKGDSKYIDLENKEMITHAFTTNGINKIWIIAKSYDGVYKVQIEEGNKITDWEPYISEPVTDIVLSPGATGNRTYTANWIEN